jgi:hypothetical protein
VLNNIYIKKNPIIKANNPVAYEKAKHKITYVNNCPCIEGFLATPYKAPKTTPMPIPAPIKPVVANPVPIILNACIIFIILNKPKHSFFIL